MAKKIDASAQIRAGSEMLRQYMREELGAIADDLIAKYASKMKRATPSQRLKIMKDVSPSGVGEYRSGLLELLAALALDGVEQARREVPKAKNVKLADPIDKLSAELAKKLKARNDLLVDKQIGDLQKTIEFAYLTNQDTIDSDELVLADLRDSAVGWLDGVSLQAGAELTAATIISDARESFFFEPDVLEQIDAFQFVNGDPVTAVCQDLAGTIFSKDDPNRFRYTPPLHWNCKSKIIAILKGDLEAALKKSGQTEVVPLKPSTKRIEDTIQFCECLKKFD